MFLDDVLEADGALHSDLAIAAAVAVVTVVVLPALVVVVGAECLRLFGGGVVLLLLLLLLLLPLRAWKVQRHIVQVGKGVGDVDDGLRRTRRGNRYRHGAADLCIPFPLLFISFLKVSKKKRAMPTFRILPGSR